MHNAPLYEKPVIANNPFTPVSETPPNRVGDGVLEVMKLVVTIFESQSSDFIKYNEIIARARMSRIMFDLYVEEAKSAGFVVQEKTKSLRLTNCLLYTSDAADE